MDDFAELVERHQTMVFRTLARLTGDREGLEDLAQEVFLRLFRALPHFRKQAQVGTFLYRIIVNVVNDEFRRRQKARLASPIEEEEHALEHSAPGPLELLEQSQMEEAVDAALLRLTEYDRAILTLHYQEDRSYEEIAAILDAPMGTVKTHLYRARERLKGMMKEWTRPCQIGQ
ncbi:MAG TPA: sigma-70 family RNA polymerase sigma factor [Bryobacteraceae bacterium]|nr:sigma-70 family RNA polymerase sigma factor [Bryobacteraceae bacterium]